MVILRSWARLVFASHCPMLFGRMDVHRTISNQSVLRAMTLKEFKYE